MLICSAVHPDCLPPYFQTKRELPCVIFGVRGVLTCLHRTAGTFLYVAFMEVIPRELSQPGHHTLKLAMLMAGFGAMSLLAVWA